jgi:three-Cys-motif partner protein
MRSRKGVMALTNDSKEHRFGGDWTETKLAILQKYLAAYTTALKGTSFRKGYIDAFAGTGYRNHRRAGDPSQPEFPELAEDPRNDSSTVRRAWR